MRGLFAIFLVFISGLIVAQDTLSVTQDTQVADTIPVAADTIPVVADTIPVAADTIPVVADTISVSGDTIDAMSVADTIAVSGLDTIPWVHDTICIIGTGDIMLGTNYPSSTYLPPGADCSPLLRPVHHILQSGDLLFGNLEGVFAGEGGTPKRCRDSTRCYVFRMPDHFAGCLTDAGYDVVSVANNHVNDFGPEGRRATAALLDSVGIAYAGFVTHPWTTFQKEGVTYGFAAFAPNKGTMNLIDYAGAAAITRMLDSVADVVIISFHGGGEGKNHQHVVRGDEEYLGTNRGSVYRFSHAVVDAGADIVFGHGPHVTRALELYGDRLICYSLGNFATYRRFNLSGPNGIAPVVKVNVDVEGKFLSGEVVPVYQPGSGGPRPDRQKRAIHKIRELSEADFPDQELVIGADGSLSKRLTGE
ncbi:MAG: CapA family protein [Bacteroidota bacterium]